MGPKTEKKKDSPKVSKTIKAGKKKKMFDKKEWRNKKYNNKNKVDQWKVQNEDRLKKKYIKVLKKEGRKSSSSEKMNRPPHRQNLVALGGEKKRPAYIDVKKNKIENAKKIKLEDKKSKAAEKFKNHQERTKALENYKDKKLEKMKILSMKTSKGQPLMRGRLELLYEKIKKQVNEG